MSAIEKRGLRWSRACGLWLAAALSLAGCKQGGGPPADFAVEVATVRPEVTVVEEALPAVGSIEADERVVLQPETPGLVESIEFREGEVVEAGRVLFRLRSRKEEAQLAQARADKDLAASNLERARTLAGTKAISRQELDQLESTLAAREATYELESRRLEERVIVAPFDGVMGPREVSVGQYVNAGTTLARLVQDATVKIEFRVPERQLAQLRPGQTGRVRVTAYPDQVFSGTVDLVDPEVDAGTRTVGARLRVPNPDRHLRPGMFARVELVVGRRAEALVVPESALVPSLDTFSVFVVEEGRARLRTVRLGVRLPGKVELLEGLSAADEVVVSGTQKIVDGTRVTPAADKARSVALTR